MIEYSGGGEGNVEGSWCLSAQTSPLIEALKMTRDLTAYCMLNKSTFSWAGLPSPLLIVTSKSTLCNCAAYT